MTVLDVSCEGGVSRLTLQRPDAGNALNLQLIEALADAVTAAERDAAIKVILLCAAGKHFCTGIDMKQRWPANFADSYVQGIGRREAIAQCRKPVIACVQGAAMGAGLELALSCDIVLADNGAKFAAPEFSMGAIPGAGATQRVTALLGRMRAAVFCYSGQVIRGSEAAAIGLVSASYDGDALSSAGEDLAATIAAQPAHASMMLKQLLRGQEGVDSSLALGLERVLAYAAMTGRSA